MSIIKRIMATLLVAVILLPAALLPAGGAEARMQRTVPLIPEDILRLEMEQRWDEAEVAYRSLLAQKPVPGALWLRYSDILAIQGKTREAAIALARAAGADPDDHKLAARASSANAQIGRAEVAMKLIETALAAAPGTLDYLDRHARLATWSSDYHAAADSLGQLVANRPGEAELHLRYGRVLAWLGRIDAATRETRRTLALQPDMPEALLDYARLLSWQGNHKAALASLEDYQRAGGHDAAAYAGEKALNLAWADRPDASLAVSGPALVTNPVDRRLLYGQAVALERAHRHAEADARLAEIERQGADQPDVVLLRRLLTLPDAPYVSGDISASTDGDNIDILSMKALASYALRDDNRIAIGGAYAHVSAPTGGGLDRIDGGENIKIKRIWAEARFDVGARTVVTAKLGLGDTDFGASNSKAIYELEISHRASDALTLTLGHARDFHAVSPRALSLGVMRSDTSAGIRFSPDPGWTLDLSARYSDFSDGNNATQVDLSLRRALLRRAGLNMDIGLSGTWYGYDQDLDNGYYDPGFYQRYLVPLSLYLKLGDGDGISLVFAPGVQRDRKMSGFAFSGHTYAEGTFGLYKKWMLKSRVGLSVGASDYTDDYWVVSGGLYLMRRF